MDNNDVLSLVGKQSQSNYDFHQQTPSQYTHNHEDNGQLLYSAGGYKQSAMSGAGAVGRGGHNQNMPMSGGAPDLGMLMSNSEFDEPSAVAMANNNSFSLGQAGPRGFNPN